MKKKIAIFIQELKQVHKTIYQKFDNYDVVKICLC